MFGNAPLGSHYPRSLPLVAKSKTHLPSFQPLAHSLLKTPGCTRIVLYPEGFLRGAILSLARPRRPQNRSPLENSPNSDYGMPTQASSVAGSIRSFGGSLSLGGSWDDSCCFAVRGSRRALALASLRRSRVLRRASHLRRSARPAASQRHRNLPQAHRRLLRRLEHRQSRQARQVLLAGCRPRFLRSRTLFLSQLEGIPRG